MKAALQSAPWEIHIEEVATPTPQEGEVRVKVAFCGVCGSDIEHFVGELPEVTVPPGHECAGVVDVVGSGVTSVRPGDRVAVEPLMACGRCRQCRTGRYGICEQRSVLGGDRSGAFAEYIVVPARNAIPLPAGVSLEEGALLEPMTNGVHHVARSRMRPGARVGVLGAGTIGLSVLQAARVAGAGLLLATAKYPHQARMAKALGADETIASDADVVGEITRLTDGSMLDVVFETVGGAARTTELAFELLRIGGRVVLIGGHGKPQEMNLMPMLWRELELVGTQAYGFDVELLRREYEIALDLVARQRVNLSSLVTHRFPLEHIADAYQTALKNKDGVVKVLVAC